MDDYVEDGLRSQSGGGVSSSRITLGKNKKTRDNRTYRVGEVALPSGTGGSFSHVQ